MSNSVYSLEDKVAIVTGGKEGIGKAIALAYARAGADVAVCSRMVEDGKLQAVAEEIQELGRRSLAVRADITRRTEVDNLVQRVVDKFGDVDILVNNAGVLIMAPLLETTEEDWDETIDTHLKGYYFCCQAVGKRMVERKRGNIINITSDWASPEASAYCIAKAGVTMLTKMLALELGSNNIRVNAIAPGATKTKMLNFLLYDPPALKQFEAQMPLGRISEADEIAQTALFLASEVSNYITGRII